MPDFMDHIQQHAEDVAADALAAQLCMDCQSAEESRAAHFKAWGRR